MSQPEWIGASNPMDEESDRIEAEECDNERCYQPSDCEHEGIRYCKVCFIDLYIDDLYNIEAEYLGKAEHTQKTSYSINTDDDDVVTGVTVTFDLLETFNGECKCKPYIVGIGRLMAEKEKAEAE